ncbi:hypothetical protein JCM8115_001182 [Rhodotorula mucilaginosa]
MMTSAFVQESMLRSAASVALPPGLENAALTTMLRLPSPPLPFLANQSDQDQGLLAGTAADEGAASRSILAGPESTPAVEEEQRRDDNSSAISSHESQSASEFEFETEAEAARRKAILIWRDRILSLVKREHLALQHVKACDKVLKQASIRAGSASASRKRMEQVYERYLADISDADEFAEVFEADYLTDGDNTFHEFVTARLDESTQVMLTSLEEELEKLKEEEKAAHLASRCFWNADTFAGGLANAGSQAASSSAPRRTATDADLDEVSAPHKKKARAGSAPPLARIATFK